MAWNVDPALLSRTYRDPLAIFGLAVDLLPVFAVLVLGWGAAPLVFLYWLENLVIGVMTVVRMLTVGAMNGVATVLGALFMSAFFTVHYGMFCFVHGIFLVALSTDMSQATTDGPLNHGFPGIDTLISYMLGFAPGMVTILAMILAFNVAVYLIDGLMRGELQDGDLNEEMGAPYGRIIVVHIGIFAGFGAMVVLGEPMLGVLGLILLRVIWGVVLAVRRRLRLDGGEKVDGASRIG
jgi:hypothetical protein